MVYSCKNMLEGFMNFKIGNYLERKMKKNQITKVELHKQLKDIFYTNEEYVSYKGFVTRFYNKLYAEDLFKISYLLGVDLNCMRDEIINSKKNEDEEIIELALEKSIHINKCFEDYSKWLAIEDDIVYIIWFKLTNTNSLEYMIEMYDLNKKEMIDITFLTYKAILEMDKDWGNKNLDERLNIIKKYNRQVYDRVYV